MQPLRDAYYPPAHPKFNLELFLSQTILGEAEKPFGLPTLTDSNLPTGPTSQSHGCAARARPRWSCRRWSPGSRISGSPVERHQLEGCVIPNTPGQGIESSKTRRICTCKIHPQILQENPNRTTYFLTYPIPTDEKSHASKALHRRSLLAIPLVAVMAGLEFQGSSAELTLQPCCHGMGTSA